MPCRPMCRLCLGQARGPGSPQPLFHLGSHLTSGQGITRELRAGTQCLSLSHLTSTPGKRLEEVEEEVVVVEEEAGMMEGRDRRLADLEAREG